MNRISIICALAVGLTGCNAVTVTSEVIDTIQTATVTACKFVPTATTIANIISAGSAAVPGQIAEAICQAVTASSKTLSAPSAANKAASPTATIDINGKSVQIVGQFIR